MPAAFTARKKAIAATIAVFNTLEYTPLVNIRAEGYLAGTLRRKDLVVSAVWLEDVPGVGLAASRANEIMLIIGGGGGEGLTGVEWRCGWSSSAMVHGYFWLID